MAARLLEDVHATSAVTSREVPSLYDAIAPHCNSLPSGIDILWGETVIASISGPVTVTVPLSLIVSFSFGTVAVALFVGSAFLPAPPGVMQAVIERATNNDINSLFTIRSS
jgi:hypothetical protein